VRAVQNLLAIVGQSGAKDSDSAFFAFRVDHDHEPAFDWPDGEEPIFEFRMLRVENLEIVDTRLEEPPDLREGQTVLSLVAEVLGRIPLELHDGGS
jgi:hypothetical protein